MFLFLLYVDDIFPLVPSYGSSYCVLSVLIRLILTLITQWSTLNTWFLNYLVVYLRILL
jgi:membrane protein insertase Oxa1/YidC/SpoIIIJ